MPISDELSNENGKRPLFTGCEPSIFGFLITFKSAMPDLPRKSASIQCLYRAISWLPQR
jgi:hypothetical protein